jgi:ssDNA-binding Zn-finger/Zn-ribbon topoisomerase 1
LRIGTYVALEVLKAVTGCFEEKSRESCLADCLHPSQCLRSHANMYAVQMVCEKKNGGCGAVVNYVPTARAMESRAKKKQVTKKFGDIASRINKSTVEAPDTPSCPRCCKPQRVWNPRPGVRMPQWRCGDWPECRVLGDVLPGTLAEVQWPRGHQPHYNLKQEAKKNTEAAAGQRIVEQQMGQMQKMNHEIIRLRGVLASQTPIREAQQAATAQAEQNMEQRMMMMAQHYMQQAAAAASQQSQASSSQAPPEQATAFPDGEPDFDLHEYDMADV